jgi:hypothetical protein
VWEEHCRSYYEQWDLSLTGFVIDGYARGLDSEGMDAFARFSPDGIVGQKVERQGVHANMPYIRMATDLQGAPTDVARSIAGLVPGTPPRFVVCRSILQTPTWYAEVEAELKQLRGDAIRVVDLYTLLWLVREYETHRDQYANTAYARAKEVTATPKQMDGVAVLDVTDGPVRMVEHAKRDCWQVSGTGPHHYIYFQVDESFYRPGSGELEITCAYRDEGKGRLVLEYDSTDSAATLGGAYKMHPQVVSREGRGSWTTVTYRLPDARFHKTQNGGADFRFFCEGDPVHISRVRVARR